MKQDTAGTLGCMIIDDEPANHQILKTHIEQIPWLSMAGSCYDAVQAMRMIQRNKPDIVFLDINMPEVTGLDLLEMWPSIGASVIITSAFEKYAIQGYDYDVISFLAKPVTYKGFLKAVHKASRRRGFAFNQPPYMRQEQLEHSQLVQTLLADSPGQLPAFDPERLWIKCDKKTYCIFYTDIAFLGGDHNDVKIYLNDKSVLRTRARLSDIGAHLPPYFVRTHRSFIVNRYQVSNIDGNTIEMHNQLRVTIIKDERNEILRRLAYGT